MIETIIYILIIIIMSFFIFIQILDFISKAIEMSFKIKRYKLEVAYELKLYELKIKREEEKEFQ